MKLEKIIYSHGTRKFSLTAREITVVTMISADIPRKEIAAKLGITTSTVKFHTAHALKKVGAKSCAAAIAKIITCPIG